MQWVAGMGVAFNLEIYLIKMLPKKMKSHEKLIDFLAHILYYKDEEKQYTP